ncbi:hypothetical protein [Xenorhabdus eapokensis]|uniref:Structural protein n=1 Tax=Xenorhabdus eapokensis TaxID=1873482 RepID=A0A1Q5TIZ1_9GAMM|nr:hypothetical protein [Xenorhabdus eapokensis]OKP00189.1 structural protein [Xenorhabdus eapokensis]
MINTALDLQEQERIINAIEKASDAELSALSAIQTDIRSLSTQNNKVNVDSDEFIISRPTRRVSKATQHNALGLKLTEAEKTPSKNTHSIDNIQNKNRIKTRTVSIPNENQTANTLKRAPNINPINNVHPVGDARIKNSEKDTIPNVVSLKSYLANKQALNGDQKTQASIAAQNIKAGHGTAPDTVTPRNNGNNTSQPRTASGRFASKDKSESLKANQAHQQETKDKAKMQASFLRKLGGIIGQSSKALADTKDSSTLDVVGSAGGSFWKAGKEAANVTSNAVNNVVSLHDWVNGKRKKKQPATQHPPIIRPSLPPLTLGSEKQTKSAKSFATQNQNDQTKAIKEQTQLTQANDEKVISLLEDLVDKNKTKKGDGILGALFSALAVKVLGKKIGGKLGAAILSALALGKLKSRVSKFSARGDEDNGIDIDVSRHDKKKTKKTKKKHKKGLKNIGKGAAKATAVVAGSAGVITAGNAILNSAEEKASEQATQKAATKGAKKATESSATKAAKTGTEKSAVKAAGKIAGKTALKAVPLVGTAIGVGLDAYDGFTDTDAQRETFGLKDGQEVTTRQQTEYALANVADLGGLVSGSAGLLADGAEWLGLDSVSDALTFNTGDIAKKIDNSVTGIINLGKAIDDSVIDALNFFSSDKPKQGNKHNNSENAELVQAVTEGTDKTTQAVNKLTHQMLPLGAEMGQDGKMVPTVFFPSTPEQNHFGNNLNIGGKNAKNRNFRNNNFGNLVYVGQKGARLEDPNAKGQQTFAKFDTPEEGMRALANQITSYANGTSKAVGYQKLNTVESIITKYAPKNENNTEEYIANLSKALGVNADQQLDLSNPETMTKMIRAISTIEGGNPQVTDEFIKNAIGTRDESANSWIGKFSPETLEHVNKVRAEKGLKAISSADQFSAPEQVSATAKAQKNKAAVTPLSEDENTGVLGSIKKIRHLADEKISNVFAGNNVAGTRLNRPDAGLTLPTNMRAENLPAGLRTAMFPVDQIAQANNAKFVKNRVHDPLAQLEDNPVSAINRSDTGSGNNATINNPTDTINSHNATQNEPIDTVSSHNEKHAEPINKDAIPIVSVNDVNKALPASAPLESLTDKKPVGNKGSIMPVAMAKSANKAPSKQPSDGFLQTVSEIALPSMADTVKSMTQGFSSSGMLDGMLGNIGLDNDKIRALSPLTGFVSQKIDSGIHGMANIVANTIRQPVGMTLPSRLPTVTDLAASGVKTPVTRDKSTSNADKAMLTQLQKISASIEKLISVQKEANNNGTDPNRTTHSAQPAPRSDIPLGAASDALSEMLRERDH